MPMASGTRPGSPGLQVPPSLQAEGSPSPGDPCLHSHGWIDQGSSCVFFCQEEPHRHFARSASAACLPRKPWQEFHAVPGSQEESAPLKQLSDSSCRHRTRASGCGHAPRRPTRGHAPLFLGKQTSGHRPAGDTSGAFAFSHRDCAVNVFCGEAYAAEALGCFCVGLALRGDSVPVPCRSLGEGRCGTLDCSRHPTRDGATVLVDCTLPPRTLAAA